MEEDDPFTHSLVWADTPGSSSLPKLPDSPAETEAWAANNELGATPSYVTVPEAALKSIPVVTTFTLPETYDLFPSHQNASLFDRASTTPFPPSVRSRSDSYSEEIPIQQEAAPSTQSRQALNFATTSADPLQQTDENPNLPTTGSHSAEKRRPLAVTNSRRPSRAQYVFNCSVSDPHKINQMGSYIAYQVKTQTDCPDYSAGEIVVSRRFSDFLWLYNRLVENFFGVIIPPIPGKQARGRFEDDFVQNRRAGLDTFIRKVAVHPILQTSEDLRAFLASTSFNTDKKKSDVKPFGHLSEAVGSVDRIPAKAEDLVAIQAKYAACASNIRAISQSVQHWQSSHQDHACATCELGDGIQSLNHIRINGSMSARFATFIDVHNSVKDYQTEQHKAISHLCLQMDFLTRLLTSIEVAFDGYNKGLSNCQNADNSLHKKRENLEKLKNAKSTRSDKIASATIEVEEAKNNVLVVRGTFESLTELLRSEIARCEREIGEDILFAYKRFLLEYVDLHEKIIAQWQIYQTQPPLEQPS
ncbi:hypothetical protein DFS34DRAFT_648473 [Phlyctochytrium arcticum]|nr:hypothetical protein DFS34DRAFT_648473 [Phlyctochytrium arcticum]